MNAEIVSIGTELLLGDIVNTNSQYLAEELSRMGINVYRIVTVGDNPARLKIALEESLSRADLVITTGGLGPTNDDLSKEVAMEVFGQEGVLHEPSAAKLRKIFNEDEERIGINIKQAMFPENSYVLTNALGTAPGVLLQKDEKRMVLLPGPPHEMKVVFGEFVKWWNENMEESTIWSRTLRLAGIGESDANHLVQDLLDNDNPTLAPYAKPYEVTFRLTGSGKTVDEIRPKVEELEAKVRERLYDYVYGADEDTLESVIVQMLKDRGWKISMAESLTGGLIASSLINVPGASEVLEQSFITYSDEAKMRILHVSPYTIENHGVVSEEVCVEMLRGLQKRTYADVCVATTGYAGPDGESVGLVYAGVLIGEDVVVNRYQFHGNRQTIRNRTTRNALATLWKMLR